MVDWTDLRDRCIDPGYACSSNRADYCGYQRCLIGGSPPVVFVSLSRFLKLDGYFRIICLLHDTDLDPGRPFLVATGICESNFVRKF